MQNLICQSCGMPLASKEQMGLEKNGSISADYCKYCYEMGEFIHKVSLQEYIEMCSLYGAQAGMSNEQFKAHCTKLFPTLKRWQEDSKRL
ncbi:zinc ribbon domain-containing protein [Helicobacter sp. MIT 21-1697]|uniref:zinc ribbon domain-containing protein n=1 Tax=Helicobacter sp. MIT 21-1697 TaxID=2993733 RepID=UPI00224B7332|nr:zinc ribbon domain-containing protein [Helicobacter sp. MIT 21-1697]MCX2717444.1 zinc ribbon domain-containing protein [Helicobacter sp. MIT 21-1697]MCX2717461.1 zinc ribbon domain-containing protein [Helicobacter sp. MIT 21-1697]